MECSVVDGLKEGEERKVLWQLNITFGVSRSEEWKLYIFIGEEPNISYKFNSSD